MNDSLEFQNKKFYGLEDNKSFEIKKIDGFKFDNFRLFHDEEVILGNQITILSGRNGTMKSTILGLMSHPYQTDFVDVHEKTMNTKFGDVFKFSLEKDTDDYEYNIRMVLKDDKRIIERIPIYVQTEKNGAVKRHRIVPSGRNKGDGFFNLPTIYTNLKRLYPLIDSGEININNVEYSENEKIKIGDFYEKILLESAFKNFYTYSSKNITAKKPFGPSDSYFDIKSISSGEDNLSTFINAMISFERIKNKINDPDILTGIWAIDEFEATLHPIAQLNLLKYLVKWSKQNRVQIVLNTHSLYLIEEIYKQYHNKMKSKDIVINFISPMYAAKGNLNILINPEYQVAREELTLSKDSKTDPPIKIKLLCEDKIAIQFLKRIIKKKKTQSRLDFLCASSDNNSGTPAQYLTWVCNNFPNLLVDNNSIVILDADQKGRASKITISSAFVLPSVFNQPLEQEVVTYIISKDNGDIFFSKYQKNKSMFKQEFTKYDIDLQDTSKTKVGNFKKWYQEENGNKYLTYYLKENKNIIDDFRESLIKEINNICQKLSIPDVE
ncbi:MAG: AAA family ATPase [Pseudolactococcus laudensis]